MNDFLDGNHMSTAQITTKHVIDAVAVTAPWMAIAGWLPPVLSMTSATLSIIWLSINIGGWLRNKVKEWNK